MATQPTQRRMTFGDILYVAGIVLIPAVPVLIGYILYVTNPFTRW